jgi:hypothetical protein
LSVIVLGYAIFLFVCVSVVFVYWHVIISLSAAGLEPSPTVSMYMRIHFDLMENFQRG